MWAFGKLSNIDMVFLQYRSSIYHLQNRLTKENSVPFSCLNVQSHSIILTIQCQKYKILAHYTTSIFQVTMLLGGRVILEGHSWFVKISHYIKFHQNVLGLYHHKHYRFMCFYSKQADFKTGKWQWLWAGFRRPVCKFMLCSHSALAPVSSEVVQIIQFLPYELGKMSTGSLFSAYLQRCNIFFFKPPRKHCVL